MIHTVFTVDSSPYLQWQSELLAHTFRKVGQPGPLTRIWAGSGTPQPFDGHTHQTPSYSYHPITGEYYAPYNLIMPLLHWLNEAPPAEDTLLFMDPDVVFLAPIEREVEPGAPIGHYYEHMELHNHEHLIKRHCRRPDLYQPVFSPMLIHRDDLRSLTPLWMQHTENIREEASEWEFGGWTATMYGLVFAAIELGIRFDIRRIASFAYEDQRGAPLIHYCNASMNVAHTWEWSKQQYTPWQAVPPPPDDTAEAARILNRELNDYARLRRETETA